MELLEVNGFINDNNLIGRGKEVSVYGYDDQVIKIFHTDRETPIERISDEGLINMTNLSLKTFNTPTDIIYDNGKIVGYLEKRLYEEELNTDYIDFESLKEDIRVLSDSGYTMQDLGYNYICSEGKFYFSDLTCFKYIRPVSKFMTDKAYKDNIKEINKFLVGLLEFGMYRKGEQTSLTKSYLVQDYILRNRIVDYYGDYKNIESKMK